MIMREPSIPWRKSSYSGDGGTGGGDCIELWRKSSYSGDGGTGGGGCVELAGTLDQVRDSKNVAGPILTVRLGPLLDAIKADALHH